MAKISILICAAVTLLATPYVCRAEETAANTVEINDGIFKGQTVQEVTLNGAHCMYGDNYHYQIIQHDMNSDLRARGPLHCGDLKKEVNFNRVICHMGPELVCSGKTIFDDFFSGKTFVVNESGVTIDGNKNYPWDDLATAAKMLPLLKQVAQKKCYDTFFRQSEDHNSLSPPPKIIRAREQCKPMLKQLCATKVVAIPPGEPHAGTDISILCNNAL